MTLVVTRMIEFDQETKILVMNIIETRKRFSTKKKCIKYLEEKRWGDTPICPYCDSVKSSSRPEQFRYQCNSCNCSYSVTVGTIFHDSKLCLSKWLLAISLILNAKKGISSRQLARDLGVDKNTAWYLQMRVRRAMSEKDSTLAGMIEVDETYIGGDLQNKTKKYRFERDKAGIVPSGMEHKQPVVGMLQRGGIIIGKVLDKAHGKTIKPVLRRFIESASTVITDGFGGYYGIHKNFKDHQIINHTQDEYVRGEFHLNTLEGFWSLLKRGIQGQYHSISSRYLQSYVNEFCFRYSYRSDPYLFDRLILRTLNLNPVNS